METRRTNIIAGITFCLYLTTVALLCFLHGDNVPSITGKWFGLPADKVAHFLMFFPFPVLGYCMMWKKGRRIWLDLLIVASTLIMGTGLAFLTEHLQEFVFDRRFKDPTVYHTGKCVFFGHTQTDCVCGESKILAYQRNHDISPKTIQDYFKILMLEKKNLVEKK